MSAEQVAANLQAALVSGNALDAESALASYDAAVEDGVDFPVAELGPIKAPLAAEEGVEEDAEEDEAEDDDVVSVDVEPVEEEDEDEEDA